VNNAVRSPVSMPELFSAAPDVNRPVWLPLFIQPSRQSDADGAAPDVYISTCSPPIMSVWFDAVSDLNLRNAVILKFPKFFKFIILKVITV
jgi:hypothetical protein